MLENERELPVERLCFGPRGVPIGDILLHQKIALEGDEEAALRIAGRSSVPIAGHVNSNGEFVQGYAAQGPGQVGQQQIGQRLHVRMAPEDRARLQGRTPPDYRVEDFGWNVTDGHPDEQTN